MQMRVGLLQMADCGPHKNDLQAKGEAYCRQAAAMGADIALFPETWYIGSNHFVDLSWSNEYELWRGKHRWGKAERHPDEEFQEQIRYWHARAIGRDDPYILHFQRLAQELRMAIALTYLERWPGGPRNTVSLIDRHGEMVLTYAKVHTCDFNPVEATCTPGDQFPVCTLTTAHGPIKVGAMICYDREFPESARMLMLRGAELILIPNACEMELNRITQMRARATENLVGVALTNYAAPDANGHSIAFDPMAFTEQGSRDTLVVEAGEQEGVYLACFDLDAIRDYRARESWGNAFRKPHRYSLLVEQRVEDPFVRVNILGERYQSSKR
jgi:N-carbamoylputrescine amidase